MADDARTTTPEDTLAWEAAHSKRAGTFAITAGLVTIVGSVVGGVALGDQPRPGPRTLTLVDTLGRAAAGQPIRGGFLAAQVDYFGAHAVVLSVASVLVGLGAFLMFPPLAFLYRAVRARRPLHQATLIALAAGVVGFGVGQVVSSVPRYVQAAEFHHAADRSNSAAADVASAPIATAGDLIRDIGMLGLAISLVIIGLNAMRVGLLTRLMGVMAMLVGATLVIQLDRLGILRAFWLGALGLMLLDRTRRPPAWASTEPVPWPTQQELREQREAARRARGGQRAPKAAGRPRAPETDAGRPRAPETDASASEAGADEPQPQPRAGRVPAPRAPQPRRAQPAGARPHPTSKKRKRKRRS